MGIQYEQVLIYPDYYLLPVPFTILAILLSTLQAKTMKKGYIIGILLGSLTAVGICSICLSSLGISEHAANLINCIIEGAALLGLCFTLYLQSRATELQAKATADQIDANRQQHKALFRQEMFGSFSAIADRKAKIKIIPPIECKLPPPEERTDTSTQFTTHCATMAIIISKYFRRAKDSLYQEIFKQYERQFYCLIDSFFPYAIAFKNAAEKIISNKILDSREKNELLQLLHETLSTNDASALGIIFRLPHFKTSEWINKQFSKELCVKSVRNSIKNVCENKPLKDTLEIAIGNFCSQERLDKAAVAFVDGLENAKMAENTYWSMYMSTCGCKE
ncbi:MAG: hypothetical protein IKZ10_06120 [Akkermansia sp.]|nr:hypothetical protein [Akkermansia sp.]